jgi:cytoskeletal protein CcmA (bactofilin family)
MNTGSTASFIAHTMVIGNVHGDGDLEVHGRVHGDVTVEGNVLVAASSQVKGSISAAAIRVAGSVEGNLQASLTVALEPTARVLGDMTTPRFSVAEGAMLRGMVRADAERTVAAPARAAATEVSSISHDSFAHGNGRPAETREAPAPGRPAPLPPASPAASPDVEPRLELESKKKDKNRPKRPPEPKVPALAKGTKGKKKGDKRAH